MVSSFLAAVRRCGAVTLSIALGAMSLAGCTGSESTPSPGSSGSQDVFRTYEQAVDEYHKTANTLTLPTGYRFPTDPRIGDKTSDMNYQEGVGAEAAVYYWYCAWINDWLVLRTTNPTQAQKALDMVASVLETDVYKNSWQSIPVDKGIEAARLGDPSFFQDEATANCKWVTRT